MHHNVIWMLNWWFQILSHSCYQIYMGWFNDILKDLSAWKFASRLQNEDGRREFDMWGSFGKGSRVIFRGSSAYDRTGALAARRLHQHQPRFLPQTPGFFASEIWICGGENLDLSAQKSSFVEAWMSEAFRRRQLFSFQCCAALSLSLQNSFPIKARNENKGRNIRRQAVSIKPHSRLTNKVGVAEKQPNASLSQYLNLLD